MLLFVALDQLHPPRRSCNLVILRKRHPFTTAGVGCVVLELLHDHACVILCDRAPLRKVAMDGSTRCVSFLSSVPAPNHPPLPTMQDPQIGTLLLLIAALVHMLSHFLLPSPAEWSP
jgi:hypothetical protein